MTWFMLLFCLVFAAPAAAQDLTDDTESSAPPVRTTPEPYQLARTRDDRMRLQLSTLWTSVTLNMIAADVLSRYVPAGRDEFDTFANGKEAELMFAGALYYQIPISMVVLSQVLPFQANRWTNRVAAGLVAVSVVAGGSSHAHYLVFAGAELVGLSIISVKAWGWTREDKRRLGKNGHIGLNLRPRNGSYGLTYAATF